MMSVADDSIKINYCISSNFVGIKVNQNSMEVMNTFFNG